jgi:DNA repair exonuclease SbcCD ATPase subunit
MRSIIVFCLLLLVGTSYALFGNKNNNNDKRRRRLTEATTGTASDIDIDAATGTVRHIPTEAEKSANSCDGKASAALLAAESERDALLQQQKEAFGRDEDLEQAVQQLNQQILSMESSHKEAVQTLEAKVQETKDAGKMNKKKKELDAKLKELEDETNVALAEKDAIVSQLTTDLLEKDANLEQLQQQLEEQAKEAEAVLIMVKEEATKFMLSQVHSIKEDMTQLQQQNKEAMSLKDQAIKELEEESKNVLEGKKQAQKSLEQAAIVRFYFIS